MPDNEISDAAIGRRIQQLREARGFSQADLAQRLREAGVNWSQGTLSKVESGERPVRLVETPTVARVLRTKIYDLVYSHMPLQTESDTKQRVRAALDVLDNATESAENVYVIFDRLVRSVREVGEIFEDITESQEEPE